MLNIEENCGHEGWKILEGKMVEGAEPPKIIQSYSTGRFSVSGREGTDVAPKGRVFYSNIGKNLKVIFEWNASGLTSMSDSTASMSIDGIAPKKGAFGKDPKPWNQKLIGKSDPNSWIYNLSPFEETSVKGSKKVSNDVSKDVHDEITKNPPPYNPDWST